MNGDRSVTMPVTVQREFVFTFTAKDQESVLRVPVPIPFDLDPCELTGRLVFEHNLPCYIETGKEKKMSDFCAPLSFCDIDCFHCDRRLQQMPLKNKHFV